MAKIKIVLVDNHQIVRDGIKALISDSSKIKIIGEAKDSEDFINIIKTQRLDIVLLGISLPTMSSIEITEMIKADYPKIKILMLSTYTSEDFIFNALKAGIDGYLSKDSTGDELLLAINEINNGNEYFSKSISDTILKSYVNSAKEGIKKTENKLKNLTKRENEILLYVLEGMNNPSIAVKLNKSRRTVETHKNSIMRKLDLNSIVDLVKYAVRNKIIEI